MELDAEQRALALKNEGNKHYKDQDYVGAEGLYSKAIIADPSNSLLYTNRAMARLKLQLWDAVVDDCRSCLSLDPKSMKAYYNLSQAQFELHDFDSAVESGKRALELVAPTDKSLPAITSHLRHCQKMRWEHREKVRAREESDLERELVQLLVKERNENLRDCDGDEERKEIMEESEKKIAQTRQLFARTRAVDSQERSVPQWMLDDISFEIMVDPVVTRSGKSFERHSIVEHLRVQQTDPITRDPLYISDLRPNLNLKEACEEFLSNNGWAAEHDNYHDYLKATRRMPPPDSA